MCWERSAGDWDFLLGRETAGGCENRNQKQETADELRQSERQVVPRSIDVNAGERASVVTGAAGVSIQDLAQPVRAGVVHVGYCSSRRIPISLLWKVDL